jgi:hypothetical protein
VEAAAVWGLAGGPTCGSQMQGGIDGGVVVALRQQATWRPPTTEDPAPSELATSDPAPSEPTTLPGCSLSTGKLPTCYSLI